MSASWMSGYVGDVTYTLGFYRELAPTYLSAACIFNGVQGPDPAQPLRYCELGCGRGFGTVLLAASNPNIEFVGIDFNPSHIAEARALAERAGLSNITFLEMSFGDAARSTDPRLSEFHVVGIHGVYTWVMPKVREEICQFLFNKLLAGGLVYNSYNTLPGWATAAPIQQVVIEVVNRSTRDSFAVMDEALNILKTLSDNKAAFIVQNPGVKARLERMVKQDKSYLAHEFANVGWQPLYVTQVMADFAESKLTYVGSASLLENRLEFAAPASLRSMVEAAPDVGMRELLKDYIVNKQFRRDLYIKGPRQLSGSELRQRLAQLAFAKTSTAKETPAKFQVPVGEITPKREAVAVLLDAIGDKVRTGAEIFSASEKAGLRDIEVIVLLQLLIAGNAIAPARSDHGTVSRSGSKSLNGLIMDATLSADTHRFLASPVLGSAIGATFVDRVFAPFVVKSAKASDAEVARLAFDRLAALGQNFRRDGKPLAKTDQNVAEIAKLVREFRDSRLPIWQSLGVVEHP